MKHFSYSGGGDTGAGTRPLCELYNLYVNKHIIVLFAHCISLGTLGKMLIQFLWQRVSLMFHIASRYSKIRTDFCLNQCGNGITLVLYSFVVLGN